jgi:muramoyltetrapeptide carboxypeptidase LdcA involved in peptidoglycan recycling
MDGMLLGGCLDILINLSGTQYDGVRRIREEGRKVIWVLEACDLTPMAIRRTLWSLSMQGWFDTAAGFLIGRPLAAFRQNMLGADQYNAVTSMLEKYQVPVIMDADIGHISPMMPLVIGADAAVQVQNNNISVKMDLGRSDESPDRE